MANKKAQLMAQFYSQCQEKGYSDMSDATQSLKAKVIATDLDLKYKDIASFYEEARQCYEQVKQEEEEKARKQQEDEARKSVSGALLAEISNIDDVDASGATVFRVFIRPDKSIYTTISGCEDKIEGAPAFNIQEGRNVLLTYHPSKAVYTSATVGGITTGGVHYTKEGYSASTSKTGKADIFAAIAGKEIMVEVVRLSEYAINAFRRDPEVQKYAESRKIPCHMYVDPTWAKIQRDVAMKMEKYESKVYALNKAADEQRFSCEWCEKIVDLVARIVNGQFPPTDEELYATAEKLAQGTTSEQIKHAADTFERISDYKDASERAKALRDKYEEVLQTEKETAVLEAEATKKRNKKLAKIIISVIVALAVVGLLVTKVVVPTGKYKDAVALMEAGQYTEAIAAFEALDGFKDSAAKIKDCQAAIIDGEYNEAVVLLNEGKRHEALAAFAALGTYKDSQELWMSLGCNTITAGYGHTVGIKSDGTVVAVGYNEDGQCNVRGWTDIVSVAAGDMHTVGLKSDGTVVAVGNNKYGQCDVSAWTDIVAVVAGSLHTVGLKSDGTVVAVGSDSWGQCSVRDWSDIVAVAAGAANTIGLKSDGTVVAVGDNEDGQCKVSGWTDIVANATFCYHTVGLKSDGTVVATGMNVEGACDVSRWNDVVAVSVGEALTVGLKSNGTVVAVGYNKWGQCKVSNWRGIVAVAVGTYHTVGLKSDGTVVVTGYNEFGQCNVSGWKNIKTP